jgi:hypothetical protein
LDYHKNCFKKSINNNNFELTSKIICGNCEIQINNKMKNTKISDYFKLEKLIQNINSNDLNNKNKYNNNQNNKNKLNTIFNNKNEISIEINENDSCSVSINSTQSSKLMTTNTKKKKNAAPKFRLPKKYDKEKKETFQKSMLKALLVKEINFTDDLYYAKDICTSPMNDASQEPGIQKISEYNKRIYYSFKERTRKLEYPPLVVEEDEIQVT